jgi:opine dehydrogenase
LVVTSAFAHKPAAKALGPYLKPGQTVVLCPGSTLGSLEFIQVMKMVRGEANIKIGELNTLPYAARGSGAEVRLLLEVKKLWLSAFPAKDTFGLLKIFRQLYPQTDPGINVLDVGLNNGNPIAHPGAALLNAGRIEYSQGEFYHYKEGITPHVADVMQSMDNERLSLCRKMGYMALPTIERMFLTGYGITKTSLYEAFQTSPVFCGEHPIKGPYNVFDRYFVEDTMYGLVTWASLGQTIGVKTPTIDAIIQLISALHQRDYVAQGERALQRYGLDQLGIEEINSYLETGQLEKG